MSTAVVPRSLLPRRVDRQLRSLERGRESDRHPITALRETVDAIWKVVEQAASGCALPLLATGDVCMHVRSRKTLQDTLTAIRLGKPVAACGYDLAPNAEQHLRSRLRLANLYPPEMLAEIDDRISEQIDRDVAHALASPAPIPENALTGVYAGGLPEFEPAIIKREW